MRKHIFEKHINCTDPHCNVCEGGLAICTVCGLVEGSLTTDCSGHLVLDKVGSIYLGKLDYRDGKWVNEPSPHSLGGLVAKQKRLLDDN